jgi:2-polyprenyl-3-methyl-5-hydroxy-6-metoxy-1,4-benzoquinol methylase
MLKERARHLIYRVPARLRARRLASTQERLDRVRAALERHYFRGWRAPDTVPAADHARDLHDHLQGRLRKDRERVIPWLDAALPLEGARILEIGCGTGASTVALAEQGARVTGVDLDEDALSVARERCAAYGVEATFHATNAVELLRNAAPGAFDMVIFFACLEHMTHDERLESLRMAWDALPPGGRLAVIETPNRLWYFDHHTSQMLFNHWLPDELAFRHSRFSPRRSYNGLYRELTPEGFLHFLRRGRGASYHEFECAIAPVQELEVVTSMFDHHWPVSHLRRPALDRRYAAFLRQAMPGLHRAWCQRDLDLVLRKPGAPA